jgi:hypothetical protein
VYSIITEIDPTVVEQLATAMEVSTADPQHREMVEAYLAELDPPPGARVVELGCGSGAIARMSPPGPASSPILIDRARQLSADLVNVSFLGHVAYASVLAQKPG